MEFGWTPDQVRRITLQEMEHYLGQIAERRQTIPEPDATLHLLRQAVFALLGVKDRPKRTLDSQLRELGAPTLTKAESDAWLAAGMPSPMKGWLERYRHERR